MPLWSAELRKNSLAIEPKMPVSAGRTPVVALDPGVCSCPFINQNKRCGSGSCNRTKPTKGTTKTASQRPKGASNQQVVVMAPNGGCLQAFGKASYFHSSPLNTRCTKQQTQQLTTTQPHPPWWTLHCTPALSLDVQSFLRSHHARIPLSYPRGSAVWRPVVPSKAPATATARRPKTAPPRPRPASVVGRSRRAEKPPKHQTCSSETPGKI